MSGYSEMEAFIASVEKLRQLNELVAKDAQPEVAAVARKSATAAETPSGDPWPPLKGGGAALRGAAAAIEASTKGNRVVLKIGPPYGFHTWGAGGSSTSKKAEHARKTAAKQHATAGTKSKFHAPRRQILPAPGEPIPEDMKAAVEASAKRVFEKAMGG